MKTSKLLALPLALAVAMSGCGSATQTDTTANEEQVAIEAETTDDTQAEVTDEAEAEATEAKQTFSLTRDDLTINETITDDADESHAITVDGTTYFNYLKNDVVYVCDEDLNVIASLYDGLFA